MLRIHFTPDDLVRISISAEPHALWEVLLSLHLLQTHQGPLVFNTWRHNVRQTMRHQTDILTTLARPKGYSPDFLTPAEGGGNIDSGIEALLSTGRRELRADIVRLAGETKIHSWAASIADGNAEAMKQLGSRIRNYYTDALQPYWPTVRARIRSEHDERANLATTSGFETMLRTLHPTIEWSSRVLKVAYPNDTDLYLEGRGLILTPSFFCWQYPITYADTTRTPMLLYPVDHELGWARPRAVTNGRESFSPRPGSLARLLGRTRATVLQTIAETPHLNTSELANTIGMSLASASQHTTVLRDAGLVITNRRNGSAQHKLSSRGESLLDDAALTGP